MTLNRWWTALAVIALGSCTPGPEKPGPTPPHEYFPIGKGTFHELGSSHDDGPVRCQSCHPASSTNFADFSCTGCHEHRQEVIDPRHATLDGYRYVSFGCYACHRDASFAHAPFRPKDSRDPSRDLSLTALAPLFSGTTIASVAPLDQTLPMQMNHDSDQVPQDLECGACHLDVSLQTFYPGFFHAALLGRGLAQPVKCGSCHAPTAPQGFVGDPAASMPPRTPPTGQMRHDAVLWANGAPTTTPAFDADCGVCHVTPVMSTAAFWSTSAVFHGALASHAQTQPGSCLDCHANTRPTGLVTVHPGLSFNHSAPAWLGDCSSCHFSFSNWSGGVFHQPGAAAPASCLPCHEGERPTTGSASGAPFDFGGNALTTHGAAQDCAVCHASTTSFSGGSFGHGAMSLASTTCAACHTSQRPSAPVTFDGGSFDHSTNGSGDCIGCHQATTSHAALSDWAGGQGYPGSNLISSTDQFVDGVVETTLKRGSNGLVTGSTSVTVRLFNSMLHTSGQIPPGLDAGANPADYNNPCFNCHTNTAGTVTSFANGKFHPVLTTQPTSHCDDCHSNMRPTGIVSTGELHPMDHFAAFSAPVMIGGQTVSSVSELDCSDCHHDPGGSWDAGVFHGVAGAGAQQTDCVDCHYPLMADSAVADVTSGGIQMSHRSTQVPVQKCDTCHVSALGNVGNLTSAAFAGTTFHDWVTTQPTACVDCHTGSAPVAATQSTVAYQGDFQWMNHQAGAVKARDCASCHLADVQNTAAGFSKSTSLHSHLTPGACGVCHGPNKPAMVKDSSTVTSSTVSGAAGTHDQIDHSDVNVTSHDCNFCHTGVGTDWSKAKLHLSFNGSSALVLNGTTGACSHCHAANKPNAGFSPDHTAFTQDCSVCHSWPGAGTPNSPDWKKPPQPLNLGGFVIASPPSDGGVLEAAVNGVLHPSNTNCTQCHPSSAGGRNAFGYDHSGAPNGSCSGCHEAGSNLVGTPWALNAPGAVMVAATCGEGSGSIADRGGDTRPIGASLGCVAAKCGAACQANHFFPADCSECHGKPAGNPALVQTGSAFASAWAFKHYFGAPAQQTTCSFCH
ncbi:MAG: hypothetical protein QM723_18880 [Myxococcaceae bacterium]